MSGIEGSANAALLLGVVVMGFSMPSAFSPRIDCEFPFEGAADTHTGFTTEAGCGGAVASRPSLRGPARLLFGLRLDVNRATREALEALPAIGPARADGIVRARTDRRFDSLADLVRVPGIGPKTSEGLRGWAAVMSGPAEAGEGRGGAHHAPIEQVGGAKWIGH